MQVINLDEVQERIRAQQGGCAPTSNGSLTRSLPRALVAVVWQLMSSLYGHKWVSSYGAEVDPDHVWAATLYGLTEVQIRHGMRQCVDQALDWPPSAPEFRKLCTDASSVSWEHARIAAADREFRSRAIPDLRDNRDVGYRQLDAMRAALGMGESEHRVNA